MGSIFLRMDWFTKGNEGMMNRMGLGRRNGRMDRFIRESFRMGRNRGGESYNLMMDRDMKEHF